MNLFQLNYCPICENELNEDKECDEVGHFYSDNLIVLYKAKLGFDIVLTKNGQYKFFRNYSGIPIISEFLEIELAEQNIKDILEFLDNKLEAINRNLLFL